VSGCRGEMESLLPPGYPARGVCSWGRVAVDYSSKGSYRNYVTCILLAIFFVL
jgi:hypothetical protein